jgi:multidrug efflux pump subunit AcrA (membrane-fusion protein)
MTVMANNRILSNQARSALRMSLTLSLTAVGALLVFGVMTLSGCNASSGSSVHAAAGGPTGGAPQGVPVTLGQAVSQSVDEGDTYLGQINDLENVQIRSQVSGRITQIMVLDGQAVKQGQALFQLDAGPQAATTRSMQAMVDSTRQEAPVIQQGIKALHADRTALLSELRYNQQQLSRLQQLATTDTVARKDVEQAETAVNTLHEKLTAINSNLQAQQARLRQVGAAVNRDLANAQASKNTLSFYTVRAPFSGTIGQVIVKVGDVADPSMPLGSVTRGGPVQLEAAIPITAARAVQPGNTLTVLDDNGKPLNTAVVRFVSPRVDPATQTVLLKADIPNQNRLLKADEKVRLKLVTGQQSRVTVPQEALFRMIGQPFVYRAVSGKNGYMSAKLQPVTPGAFQGNAVVVAQGLQAGDRIVVHGIQKLQDGAPIMDASQLPKTLDQAPASDH